MVVGSSAPLTYIQYSRQSTQVTNQINDTRQNNQAAQADSIVRHAMKSRVQNEQTQLTATQNASRGSVLDMTA